jgi:hypothetical protein
VYLIGRAVYARAYVRDPKSRSLGFGLTSVPMLLMLLGILIWSVKALIAAPAA